MVYSSYTIPEILCPHSEIFLKYALYSSLPQSLKPAVKPYLTTNKVSCYQSGGNEPCYFFCPPNICPATRGPTIDQTFIIGWNRGPSISEELYQHLHYRGCFIRRDLTKIDRGPSITCPQESWMAGEGRIRLLPDQNRLVSTITLHFRCFVLSAGLEPQPNNLPRYDARQYIFSIENPF